MPHNKKNGFRLTGLIGIVGILAAMAIPRLIEAYADANSKHAPEVLASFETANSIIGRDANASVDNLIFNKAQICNCRQTDAGGRYKCNPIKR
ncbi:MAG: hypothetical protein LBI42_08940 [Chitinispirillales bacterium]|jgi:type II secretory pathway pseudopilin PulG|nr:hypothetical protein [Chitinispirillales bacterium]